MSWQIDEYIGELRPWPKYITVFRGNTDERKVYVPSGSGTSAPRLRVTVDERRAIGHDECGACGATVGIADRYCRMCGAELGDA